MKRLLRKIHRWLGLLMALQIVLWMGSGFYFSLFPIEVIRGEHLTRETPMLEPGQFAETAPLDALGRALDADVGAGWRLDSLDLYPSAGRLYWRARGQVDGQPFRRLLPLDGSGIVPKLSAAAAERQATSWLRESADAVASEWIEAGAGGHDLRGREGPAWRVTFAEPEPLDLYLDPWTGELLARRTPRWRLFDFLWMLHIMDYETREDFNHPLLQAAAATGLLVVFSGLAFWLLTRRRRPGRAIAQD